MATQFTRVLQTLSRAGADFILIDGVAGAPPGLPFAFDSATIVRGLNFTLTTDLGALDLLGEVVGGGTYEELLPRTQLMEIHDVTCRCVDLPTLIHLKRAAGRPKDSEAVAELELILEQRRRITPAS